MRPLLQQRGDRGVVRELEDGARHPLGAALGLLHAEDVPVVTCACTCTCIHIYIWRVLVEDGAAWCTHGVCWCGQGAGVV